MLAGKGNIEGFRGTGYESTHAKVFLQGFLSPASPGTRPRYKKVSKISLLKIIHGRSQSEGWRKYSRNWLACSLLFWAIANILAS